MPAGRPTAYAVAMAEKRKREAKPKGVKALAKKVGVCGARKKDGTKCKLPKGFGTGHPGFNSCKFHGGELPSVRSAAARDQAILMGAPIDINPLDGLIWCIKVTAGEVEFCTQQMAALHKDDWIEDSLVGKQLHLWAKERQKAVERLAKFCKDALGLGIAERAVRMAEMYGSTLARYTRGILNDLELTPDQIERAPGIIRKHLAILESGAPIVDEDRRRLPEIPARVA